MKIALPTRNNVIDSHFGHCEYFTVLTVNDETREVVSSEKVESPEGCGCKSNIAGVLADMGVELMLAGNMGNGAVNVLNNAGIKVVRGCAGDIDAVASNWLKGAVVDSGESCDHHDCNH